AKLVPLQQQLHPRRRGQPCDAPEGVMLTFDVFTADADAVRQHLGHEKVIVIGHSYGGFIAQEYAIAYPDALMGLLLIDTVPVLDYQPTPPGGTEEQLAAFGAAFTRPMENDEDWRNTWTTLSQMYFHDYDPAVGDALDAATHYSAAAWNQANALLATYNTLEGLPSITVPTLIVAGEGDFITPPAQGAERLGDLIPNAQVKMFADSRHYPFIEAQDAFFSTLREWLGQFQ
ncbi:MAG: alpha/beta fold hydrolase, partial [Chloroflexota bacterium]